MAQIMTQKERFENVRKIIREDLEKHFKDEFVFDPIVVEPALDEFGDGTGESYLRIAIVFKGDQDRLDPAWTSGLIRRIRPKLLEIDINEFPSPSFVKESEW